jgi:DNA-binding NarL/FixJ family response regulator
MKVIIVDDDPFVVQSLDTILSASNDIEVSGTGTDGTDAVRLFGDASPDVVLMDIQMKGMGGLEAAEAILASDPQARIVFLTTFSDDDYIVRALRLGAKGYLIKQDVSTIAPALRAVMAGQSVLEGEVLERATSLNVREAEVPRDESALTGLSEREREVVRAVAEGLDNAQVADELCMSEGTVRNHISAILAKLGAQKPHADRGLLLSPMPLVVNCQDVVYT